MNLNSFTFSRERRQFGRQCTFSDRNELLFSIPQRADLRTAYIRRNPVHCGTQLGVQKALSTALTENVTLAPHGIVHLEGGWPKDVNTADEEQTLRHRKKIEREDSWGVQVVDLSKSATECVLQNSAINIYEEYFSELQPADIRSTFASRSINVFHDAKWLSRPIVQIDWSPGNQRHLLSVHSNLDYYPSVADPNEFFLWDIENPLKVVLTFRGPTWARKACFCPRDEALIAGGFTSGKVCLWDARLGGDPMSICPLEAAHREAVTALCWVHSKTNTEFYTGSADGSILYWDGRNLKKWYMEFLLDPEKTDNQLRSRATGCTVLDFEYTIPIRYVVGDDMGKVFLGNRKGMTPTEALILNYKLFSGPIRTIERNPFFVKNFLIVGDWCAKVWSEECKDFPTTLLVRKNVQLMCGTWSTSRCSVFATGDMNGVIDFWDLLLNQTIPVFSLNLGHTITGIKFRKDGEVVAVSLMNGDIRLLELDDALRSSGAKEKSLLASIFERETYRSKLLQDRVEEIKLRETLAAAAKQKQADDTDDYGTFEEGEGEEVGPRTAAGAEPEELDEEEEEKDPDPEYTQVRDNFLNTINQIREKWKEREFISEHTPFEGDYFEVRSTSETVIGEHENDELE